MKALQLSKRFKHEKVSVRLRLQSYKHRIIVIFLILFYSHDCFLDLSTLGGFLMLMSSVLMVNESVKFWSVFTVQL